jgi:aerobic carbon-monoxide dehydrogenase small subunit
MNSVSLTINGVPVEALVEPRTHLADFIREDQSLTGTHIGCEHGVCGACTVLIDGAPARSCITYAVACEGAAITTVEGLEDEISTELREAFSREHALQCGYCTPGMLVSARDAVLRLPDADEHEIRVLMSGNLCRCTGYVGIVRAVKSVIADRRACGIPPIAGGGIESRGPVGSAHAAGSVQRIPQAATPRPMPAEADPASRVEDVQTPRRREEWRPQVTLEQHFTVGHPPERVWAFFGRPAEVAACLPGAVLTGEPSEDHVKGKLRVKAGPIVAEFSGSADIERDVAHYAGMIRGQGQDTRSGSLTRGEIAYQLSPESGGTATRVDVTIGYTLTGMLAQFSRSGLIHDIANRLTQAFVKNLEARLGAGEGTKQAVPAPAAELNAGSLIVSILGDRLRRLLRRLVGR